MRLRLVSARGLSLAFSCALVATSFVSVQAAESRTSAPIPAAIPADCSADATEAILAWVASVPDRSVLTFAPRACYLLAETLEVSGRRGLRFEGNRSTFRSASLEGEHPLWRFVDSKGIVLRSMTLNGAYADGGTFSAELQHAHGIDLRGSSVDIGNVTITDVAGDCVYFGRALASATRSSGTLHESACLRSGRNGVAVVAGDDIVVQRVRTEAIGYNVFDVEPNPGRGYGSDNVRFSGNTIGSYARNAYSIVESGPIRNQFFVDNRVVGHGLKVAVGDPTRAGFRPARVTITGNRSQAAQAPAAVNVDNVDGLTVEANTVALTGGPMISVRGSCGLVIRGNRYPGGSMEALVHPSVCSVTPPAAHEGALVELRGSGLTGATGVEVAGRPACFTVRTGSRMTFVVPAGAGSGPITVRTPVGVATSRATFRVRAKTASRACVPK